MATGNGKAARNATSKLTSKPATVATVVGGGGRQTANGHRQWQSRAQRHVQTHVQTRDGGDGGGRWWPANGKWPPAMAKPRATPRPNSRPNPRRWRRWWAVVAGKRQMATGNGKAARNATSKLTSKPA